MTSAALAGAPAKVAPMQLTDAQLDNVTAGLTVGGLTNIFVPIQGVGGSALGGACQLCVGPAALGGSGISFSFSFDDNND
jgi:hypothetical protein